jgi:hypothetical protein
LSNNKDFDMLEKITSDLCGPINPNTYNKYKYFITFLDKKTRFLKLKLLRTKDEAYRAFVEFKEREENNKDNKRIRIYATDNGTEFINNKFKSYLINHGITHQLSLVYTLESNGLAERINRTILNKVRCLLFNSNLPKELWGEAAITATYLYNRTPHSKLDFKTPYELKYNQRPDISHIKTFGSIAFYKNKHNIKKLDPRANKGILIGLGQNMYKIWDINNKKFIWSRDVTILENKFINNNNSIDILEDNNEIELEVEYNDNNSPQDIRDTRDMRDMRDIRDTRDINNNNSSNNNILNPSNIENIIENNNIPNSQETSSSYTLDNDNNNDNSAFDIDELALIVNLNNEPNNYKEAISSPNNKEWIEAMQKEINELNRQNTWNLATLPDNRTTLRGKWVYKIKTDINNNIIKYKARWVVKGFNQVLGIDYLDTFSTTCKPELYRTIFILAMQNRWNLHQYDVKNAFVHADIDKEIYIEQLIGFEKEAYIKDDYKLINNISFAGNKRLKTDNISSSNKSITNNKLVCKLNKALYGLKQSPRLWYKYLLDACKEHGFIILPFDKAIFIHEEYKIIIICHIDDLIITGPNETKLNNIITKLSNKLKLEYIGLINQFLGMEINLDYKNKTILIHQTKYLNNIMTRFNKGNLTPVLTPVELGIQLYKSDEKANKEDLTLY